MVTLYSAILHNIQICKSGNNERFINEGTLIRAILNDPSQNAYFVNTYGWPSTEGEQETELLRDVFYLYFRRQLSSKDIAQHLQIPTQTINTFITRAMKTVYYIFT